MKKPRYNGTALKTFGNFLTCRPSIKEFCSGIAGCYLFTNLINGKKYIGSAGNIYKRMCQYYSPSHLESNKDSMLICKALLKHGMGNFSLSILDICSNPQEALAREQFYLDNFSFQYNRAVNATAPFSGRKHSPEARAKITAGRKNALPVIVIKITNGETIEFLSVRACARYFSASTRSIIKAINNNSVFRGIYTIKFKTPN